MRRFLAFLQTALFFLLLPEIGSAQTEGISIVSAENYYLDKDYRNAFAGFEDYLANIKFDKDISYKAGISACRLGIQKRAILHLQEARSGGITDNYFSYWLGRSFMQDNQWDSATIYLEKYMDVFPVDRSFQNEASRFLKHISFSRSMAFTGLQPIVIENLGPGINSPYSEFHPLITADGNTMVISSRKKGFADEKIFDDGEYKEKIFISQKQEDGSWARAVPIKLNEGRVRDNDFVAIQLLNKDTKLLLFKIVKESAHLYVSDYENGAFKIPYRIPIEPDPRFFSGDIIFTDDLKSCIFTMDGNTNYFQNDLFFSRYDEKLDRWSEPVSLGKTINSNREEGSPFLAGDSILYFSSKSEKGIGEFDVFRSRKDKNGKWGAPVNMGFPYNTANNDLYFYFTHSDTSVHYISSLRGSTKGLADIYKVRRTAISEGEGQLIDEQGNPLKNARILFEDPENFQNIPVSTDSIGRFKASFVAGVNYLISIRSGEKFMEGNFNIPFPLSAAPLHPAEIRLKPRVVSRPAVEAESVE